MTALHRRPSTAVNGGLLVVIVAVGIWAATSIRDASADDRTGAAGVRTVTAVQGTVTRSVTADGSVVSARTATATFGTAGTVNEIAVRVGDRVKKGALLARIDQAPAQRQLELARADLIAADDALDRAEAAGADTTSAQNAVTQAELAVDIAEAGVTGTQLRAPIAGTVVAINGSLGGSSVRSSTGTAGGGGAGGQSGSTPAGGGRTGTDAGFVDLADLSRLQITAAFSEADATGLKTGQSATVTWNALQGAEASGRVVAVAPTATTSNSVVTYGVTVSLPKPPKGAKPGQTVTVAVVTGTAQNVVSLNSAAVTTVDGQRQVTVLNAAGGQEVRTVEVGLAGDGAYEIEAGLTSGERVVLPISSTTGESGAAGRMPGGGPPPSGSGQGGGR